MSTSPYKRLRNANNTWIPFTRMNQLDKNRAYKMVGITETDHPQYGSGQQATLSYFNGKKMRTQLPGKYLATLTSDDINIFKSDIAKGKNPFLIYREQMVDNSYRIDIIEACPEMEKKFVANEEIEELEILDDNIDSTQDETEVISDNKAAGENANLKKEAEAGKEVADI